MVECTSIFGTDNHPANLCMLTSKVAIILQLIHIELAMVIIKQVQNAAEHCAHLYCITLELLKDSVGQLFVTAESMGRGTIDELGGRG